MLGVSAQNIGLPNHELKSALNCTVRTQCTPVPVRQTDGRTNIMAIARRFILTNASCANNVAAVASSSGRVHAVIAAIYRCYVIIGYTTGRG